MEPPAGHVHHADAGVVVHEGDEVSLERGDAGVAQEPAALGPQERRAAAGHDDLAQLERIELELEVHFHRAGGELDQLPDRLVAHQTGQHGERHQQRRHGRKGTLWEDRFRSVLVEGAGLALATMAAYIDLNPVRAGMVEDPKDYRWSGYGAAMAGRKPC